jgi:serine/threonine protein kinase
MVIGTSRLIHEIGSGGISKVFLGEIGDKACAVKVLRPESAKKPEIVAGFVREVRILSGLNHPQIPTILEEGKAGNLHFAVLDLVLGRRLDEFPLPLALPLALYVIRQCCAVLRYVHSTSVFEHSRSVLFHGDLSPSNLLLTKEGAVKLIDFGSAGQESPADPKERHQGKLYYLPPDILSGKPFSTATDIYSLGVIAFEMLFGQRPFEAASRLELLNVISTQPLPKPDCDLLTNNARSEASLRIFFNRALHKNPRSRFQNISDFEKEFFKIQFVSPEAKSPKEALQYYPAEMRAAMNEEEKNWQSLVKRKPEGAGQDMRVIQTESMLTQVDRRKHPRIPIEEAIITADVISARDKITLKCEVHELSEKGMLIRWEGLIPRVGEEYLLSLHLDPSISISGRGKVTYEVSRNSRPFAGVELLGLSKRDWSRLSSFVAKKLEVHSTANAEEESTTEEKLIDVIYKSEAEYKVEYDRNIRFGGISVKSKTSLPNRTKVVIRLEIPGRLDKQVLHGSVVSCMPAGSEFWLGIQLN